MGALPTLFPHVPEQPLMPEAAASQKHHGRAGLVHDCDLPPTAPSGDVGGSRMCRSIAKRSAGNRRRHSKPGQYLLSHPHS
jgi:hypothetical protein